MLLENLLRLLGNRLAICLRLYQAQGLRLFWL